MSAARSLHRGTGRNFNGRPVAKARKRADVFVLVNESESYVCGCLATLRRGELVRRTIVDTDEGETELLSHARAEDCGFFEEVKP